jgi:5-formyltetrahydrofolate cyclo-ligase
MEEKKIVRNQIRQKLHSMPKSSYEKRSSLIAQNVRKLKEWEEAKLIAITISNFPEVDTRRIIENAWMDGKKVAVPKCEPKSKTMHFRKLESFEQLERVFFGLWEPILDKTELVEDTDIDLMFVPGLAFNRKGYRLGFGGGYYDRYLSKYSGITVSLAFSDQLLDNIPVESHDLPVDKIITPNEVIVCEH